MNYELPTWHFGIDNDRLVDLVLNGKKTATTYIYKEDIEAIGTESILIYENEKQACITKVVKNIICEFKDVEWETVKLEGETDSLEEWISIHEKYFKSIDKNFNDNTKIVIEIFKVVKNIKEERLEIGKKIALNNLDIIGNVNKIEEINAGFNNSIFNVNDKYIIKVCGNKKEENLFDIEYNFYNENKDNINIPKLYIYDNTKLIVPYYYEIIEYIDGKSVYYYWYKWNENEREIFIKKLMNIIKNIHIEKDVEDNWNILVKNEIMDNYNKCKNLFNDDEQNIVENTINNIDNILIDNRYALIHNDLHFDNIIIDKSNNIKLIDFNDSIIAPIDYDLRLLFMCEEKPWKWANSEMDPYQKPIDYKNIIIYIKKYYNKLNEIKDLDKRMYIYFILNDIRHLPKYKSEELKISIINNCKKINKE